MADFAKTWTRRERSASDGSPLKWSPAARRAFLTPSASMKSLVTEWPIRSALLEVGELPKTTTSPCRFSPPDEVIATSEYRSQLRRTMPSDIDDSETSPDDQSLFSTLLRVSVRHFDPFTRDRSNVWRDHARASAREHEDDLLGHVARGNVEKFSSPLAQHDVSPPAAPVIVKARTFGLSHQGHERVGLDLSLVRQLLQRARVRRSGHRTDEQFHTLSLHPITSFQTWRPLKTETGHLLELLSEIEQLIFLRKPSHKLTPTPHALVHTRRHRDRR